MKPSSWLICLRCSSLNSLWSRPRGCDGPVAAVTPLRTCVDVGVGRDGHRDDLVEALREVGVVGRPGRSGSCRRSGSRRTSRRARGRLAGLAEHHRDLGRRPSSPCSVATSSLTSISPLPSAAMSPLDDVQLQGAVDGVGRDALEAVTLPSICGLTGAERGHGVDAVDVADARRRRLPGWAGSSSS